MAMLETPDAAIHFRLDGAPGAPHLVLSNSLGTDLHLWDGLVAALGHAFHILRYDSRGHGGSQISAAPYAIADLGRDVVALMDAVGWETAHFCGLSMGGMVGMWLGAHVGGRIERLVLCDTATTIGARESWDARARAVREAGMAGIVEAVLARWFTQAFRDAQGEEAARFAATLRATPAHGYAQACEAIRDADLGPALADIAARTLVIAGAQDPVTPPEAARVIAANIAGARVAIIEGAAHLANVERPAAFARLVEEFLRA